MPWALTRDCGQTWFSDRRGRLPYNAAFDLLTSNCETKPAVLNRRTGLLLALIAMLLVGYGLVRVMPAWLHNGAANTPSSNALPPDDGTPQPIGPGAAYLRGAHWFGGGWAVNFWNTRLEDRAAEDFAALRADGFNTVVLVIPWPGFVESAENGALVPERAERLGNLIDMAGDAGLNVILRIGYAYDSAVQLSGRWLLRLWFEEPLRLAWLEYIAALWEIAESRPQVRFAFITWEDLWAITGLGSGNAQDRLNNAGRSGYRAWLEQYSDLQTVRERYGVNFSDWSEVPVPRRMEPAYGMFMDFIDHAWIHRFFKPAQAVFPTLSMEVRIDSDPIWNGPGDLAYWHSHELAWDLPGAPWTTVYWSPAMGSANQGDTLSPERAVELLEFQMTRLRAVTGNRPIFIDQFLVEDFTPGFEMNDRLARDSVDEFLELATPVLRALTHGYALWAWRDYEHNAVPSPDFSRTADNWVGERELAPDAGSYRLARGETLQRDFAIHEFHAPGGPKTADLCFSARPDGDPAPDLLVRNDHLPQGTALDVSGNGRDCVQVPVKPRTSVTVEAIADLDLTAASFSGFTQPIGIRSMDGSLKGIAQAWRDMNRALDRADPAPFPSLGDGWMGKTLSATLTVPRTSGPLRLSLDTNLPADWPFEPEIHIESQGKLLGTVPCIDNRKGEIILPPGMLEPGRTEVLLTVSRTYRTGGDERRLGCLVGNIELQAVD